LKRVVSISLGSSKRNKTHEVEILGEHFRVERIGADGDLDRFAQLFEQYDGKVDALGIGGADLYIWSGAKRYEFKQIRRLIAGAKTTPVVDGSGLKHTLERDAIRRLHQEAVIDFTRARVLLVNSVDRFGMAQAFDEICPNVVYGDLMFSLGLPIRVRRYATVQRMARLVLPIVTRLPFKWFYPTGEKQDARTPRFKWAFDEADVVAGDSLYILRYAPERMPGKTLITQSVRAANLEFLRQAGAARVITTTPLMDGETFATNVMEALIVALLGKRPETMTERDYSEAIDRLEWRPNVLTL
jgi:hypothetical protein